MLFHFTPFTVHTCLQMKDDIFTYIKLFEPPVLFDLLSAGLDIFSDRHTGSPLCSLLSHAHTCTLLQTSVAMVKMVMLTACISLSLPLRHMHTHTHTHTHF